MVSEKMNSILLQLRGAELKVPNMRPLYKDWTSGVSPHYEDMVSFTNGIYEKLLSNPDELKKAKACNFGYTSAGWFPTSDVERLKFMATYCAWFFTWDDATDRENVSLETGNKYRAEALEYIKRQLGLSENGQSNGHVNAKTNGNTNGSANGSTNGYINGHTNGHIAKVEPETLTPQLELFASIGKSIRDTSDDDLAKFFFNELQYIIDCCGKEQENKLSGELPTTEEYWDMRYGTSGVTAYCAVAPYMIDVKIPSELFQSPEMKAVWLEMNVNVIIFNDIISLKKEVADDAIVSLIPVIMADENVGLPEATSIVYEKLVTNCKAFDQAVVALRQKVKAFDEATQSNVEKLITCYEAFLCGVMNWSYTNARYKVAQDIQKDGSLLVTL